MGVLLVLLVGHFRPQHKQNPAGLVPVDFGFGNYRQSLGELALPRSFPGLDCVLVVKPTSTGTRPVESLLITPIFQRSARCPVGFGYWHIHPQAPVKRDATTIHLERNHRSPLISYVSLANNALDVAKRHDSFSSGLV